LQREAVVSKPFDLIEHTAACIEKTDTGSKLHKTLAQTGAFLKVSQTIAPPGVSKQS
jgi:hypothetical protein